MAHKGFVDYPRSTQETASNTWQGPRSSLLSPRAVAGFTVAQFPSWDHDWVGPARRRTRRFITDFYSDTDGFVNGRRDYVERRIQIREREDPAIPRGTESRDREEGHVICHRGRSVIRGQSSLVTASRRVRYCYCDNVLSCVSGSKSGRWLLIGETIVDPESNKANGRDFHAGSEKSARFRSSSATRSPVNRENRVSRDPCETDYARWGSSRWTCRHGVGVETPGPVVRPGRVFGIRSTSAPTGDMSTKFIIDSMLPAKYQQFHPQQLFSSAPGTIQACTTSPATASLESSLSAAAVAAAAVNYAHQHNSPSPTGSSPQHSGSSASTSPAARTSSMYPYVSAAAAHHHHQQQQAVAAAAFGATSSMVPGFGSTAASSAALAAAAAVDAAAGDKSCRYTASLTGNVTPASADPMVNYTLGHHHQNGATPGSLVSSASASSAVSAASASMAAAAQFYHQAAAASAVVDPLTSCQQPTTGQPGISDIPRYPWMSITGESFFDVIELTIFIFLYFFLLLLTIVDRRYARTT